MTRHAQLTPLRLVATIALSLLVTPMRAAANDVLMEWNQIALAASAAQGPVPQVRTRAVVHVSVHDAVNAVSCDYRIYLAIGCGAWGAAEAGAIGAGPGALGGVIPAQ